ncbi:hypothetical protein [uncultured Hyphomicrobium sp.]|uniref:hypothetical protein n=1 Tax=uncultured Hyphomicrobium sp. TaxID=194373 RepID=UPI0025EF8063|nr:hypothetical protein [uncultured Hyphomicrobium sp.]
MKTAVFALSAAVLAFACTAPASAAMPAATGATGHASAALHSDGVTQVQYKKGPYKKGYNQRFRKGHRHGLRPGGRYKDAPRGWHRYDRRPGDWHRRGCIIVGPIWWCP